MRKLALSALVIGAAAAMDPAITPAQAGTAGGHKHHMHMTRHHQHWRHHYGTAWYGTPAAPMVRPTSQSGWVCPGIGRSFDCKVWPPPFEDDPDRKTSKY